MRLIAALWVLLASFPSWAMDMKVEGASVVLSGSVVGSECTALEQVLSQNKITAVVLTNSGGGDAKAGYCVGDLVRARGLATVIRGRCASSCSRMWLGGVDRTLDGPNSRVGLHGNYNNGGLDPAAPQKLRAWIPLHAPDVDNKLMEEWIHLPSDKWMMYFYNAKAELCGNGSCKPVDGRTAFNAGLATR